MEVWVKPACCIPMLVENFQVNMCPQLFVIPSQRIRLWITIDYWDTLGQDDYDRLRPLSYPDTHIFLLCFSTVNPASFDHVITKWVPEIQHHNPSTPFMLVGTKIDLRQDGETLQQLTSNHLSPITYDQGNDCANRVGAYAYYECSAKTQRGLKRLFDEAARCVWLNRAKSQRKKKDCIIL